MTSRDPKTCLASTADLVAQARQRADDAEWDAPGSPDVIRLRALHERLRARYEAGETVTPLF